LCLWSSLGLTNGELITYTDISIVYFYHFQHPLKEDPLIGLFAYPFPIIHDQSPVAKSVVTS
jgi:hypothetical protein